MIYDEEFRCLECKRWLSAALGTGSGWTCYYHDKPIQYLIKNGKVVKKW